MTGGTNPVFDASNVTISTDGATMSGGSWSIDIHDGGASATTFDACPA